MGFRHYLSDAGTELVNGFVRKHAVYRDTTPPQWTSTYNDSPLDSSGAATAPTPRVGIQAADRGERSVTVRWDVALDLHPVSYRLYLSDRPIQFRNNEVIDIEPMDLTPEIGAAYTFGSGPNVFPYQKTVADLEDNRNYYFCIRAVDSRGNEDTNSVVLQVRPLSSVAEIEIDGDFDDWDDVATAFADGRDNNATVAGPDWREVRVANDEEFLYFYYRAQTPFNVDGSPLYPFSRTLMCIDVDDDHTTGFGAGPIGSEIKLAGDGLFQQRAGVFADQFLQNIVMSDFEGVRENELKIPLSRLDDVYGFAARRVRIRFINDEIWDTVPDTGFISYDIIR